jgi:hypothetical protein
VSVYASVEDVRARWDGDATTERIQAFLDDAEMLLAQRVTDIPDRLFDGRLSTGMLRIVLCRVVSRLLNNPAGYKGEHAGEVGYYYGTDQGVPGQLGFTTADLTDLGLDFAYRPRSVRLSVPSWGPGGALGAGECW